MASELISQCGSGMVLADHDCGVARSMKASIRSQIDAGKTKEEILDLAESGQYLEDIITPYFRLEENLSHHCEVHDTLLEGLSNLVSIYFDSEVISDTRLVESIGNITEAATNTIW